MHTTQCHQQERITNNPLMEIWTTDMDTLRDIPTNPQRQGNAFQKSRKSTNNASECPLTTENRQTSAQLTTLTEWTPAKATLKSPATSEKNSANTKRENRNNLKKIQHCPEYAFILFI